MSKKQPVILISDACVLIDFCSAGCEEVFGLISKHVMPIGVPRLVLKEVEELPEADAQKLGITPLDPTPEQWQEASVRGGVLSMPDKLCFALARDMAKEARETVKCSRCLGELGGQ